jgi:hypothetical protein
VQFSRLLGTTALTTLCLVSTAAQAAPAFVNGLTIDGASLDLSGGTQINDGRVGFFSDIYYDAARKEWMSTQQLVRWPTSRSCRP